GVDAEAVEHPEPDLGMALEHEPLGVGERARLSQDLLRDRELAEVVQAAGEARELDLFAIEADAVRNAGREIAHALRVATGVRVPRVDRLCQRGRRAVARGLVRARG